MESYVTVQTRDEQVRIHDMINLCMDTYGNTSPSLSARGAFIHEKRQQHTRIRVIYRIRRGLKVRGKRRR